MNRFFSIPAILRLVPLPVLLRFFQKMGLDPCAVNWQNLSSGDVLPIIAAISRMGIAEQMAIKNTLLQISDLACDSGIAALREAGGRDMHLADGPLCTAMLVWIEHPEIFELATILHPPECLLRWRRRIGLPKIAPKVTNYVLLQLGRAIASLLANQRSPCGSCSVEYMRRPDGTDGFAAYPDGNWQTMLIHDANGDLVAHHLRPILELLFIYDRTEGVLETCADVPATLELQCIGVGHTAGI
jgi:hypothetical protein